MYNYSYWNETGPVTNHAELYIHADVGCVVADEAGDFEWFQWVDEFGILDCTEYRERHAV